MVHNVAWLQMALIVCYMPSLTVILFRMVTQRDEKPFFYYSAITVLFMNSSVNVGELAKSRKKLKTH